MSFAAIKLAHMVLAAVSIVSFSWRALFSLIRGSRLGGRFWRVAPHTVDSLLFSSGAWLAWQSAQYPFANSLWLSAKMLALAAYIAFGLLALRYSQGRVARASYTALALACAGIMVFTALHKSPLFL